MFPAAGKKLFFLCFSGVFGDRIRGRVNSLLCVFPALRFVLYLHFA